MTNFFAFYMIINCFPHHRTEFVAYPILVLVLVVLVLLVYTSFIKIHPLNKDLGLAIYSQPDIIDQFSNTVDQDAIPTKGTQSKLGKWLAIILVILMLLAPLLTRPWYTIGLY